MRWLYEWKVCGDTGYGIGDAPAPERDGGGVSAHSIKKKEYTEHGYFKNDVFYNGHIRYVIHGFHSKIYGKSGKVIIKDIHPTIFIKRGYRWVKLRYKVNMFLNYTVNGRHYVVVEGHHNGSVNSYLTLIYREKQNFSLYRPLFPGLTVSFSKPVIYRVVWKYHGVSHRYFKIIDNGTGYTEPPFRHGHMKRVLFRGVVKKNMVFKNWQDIAIGYIHGRKTFGFNWEFDKEIFKTLAFKVTGQNLDMSISSDELNSGKYNAYTFHGPIPDTGSEGGPSVAPKDSDHDGLADLVEKEGWGIYVRKEGSNSFTYVHVTSSPYLKDTDNDGLSDYEEYQNETNPRSKDTDGDGLTDRQELEYYHTNPDNWCTYNDGVDDSHRFNYWLILGYLDGDNTLSGEASEFVSDVLKGINDSMVQYYSYKKLQKFNRGTKIVLMEDRDGYGDTKTYEIDVKDGIMDPVTEKKEINLGLNGEQNMASPATLSKFIKNAREMYWQYNHVALVIFDHGGGWTGLLQDEHPQGLMQIKDFRNAIVNSHVHINFMMFDACLMSMAEFIYEIRGLTDYAVMLEDTGYGWNMENMMSSVGKEIISNTLTARKLARIAVYSYVGTMYKYKFSVAAIDMKNVTQFISAISKFSSDLKSVASTYSSYLKGLISETHNMSVPVRGGDFYNHSFRDLYDFAKNVYIHFQGNFIVHLIAPNLISDAQGVMSAINSLVTYLWRNQGYYHGISIFLPDEVWWKDYTKEINPNVPHDYFQDYESLDFSSSTMWSDLIYSLYPHNS